ncbi:hypothetical protein [Synechococcus sp. M16CYN]|uniref:hypothetical protein n=1 Tax=Synechococcus sp. M16CYN TaxID=3103139 RepID=UPI00333EDA47
MSRFPVSFNANMLFLSTVHPEVSPFRELVISTWMSMHTVPRKHTRITTGTF